MMGTPPTTTVTSVTTLLLDWDLQAVRRAAQSVTDALILPLHWGYNRYTIGLDVKVAR
jgi:hypothetical protein